MSEPTFTEEQVRRYARHIILPGIGGDGQRKLLDAKVLCIGAGGLGSPVAMYLAAAGVGTLGILDFDRVDEVRAGCDAILVGAATVRKDNPRLVVRAPARRDVRVAGGRSSSSPRGAAAAALGRSPWRST